MTLYTESVADQTDRFADAFVPEKVVTAMALCRFYLQPAQICLEKSSVRKWTI